MGLKDKLYRFIVDKNLYVKDEYQLPIDIDREYHNKHRVQDLFRLFGLLIKYRVFRAKPSSRKLTETEALRAKKFSMPEYMNPAPIESSPKKQHDRAVAKSIAPPSKPKPIAPSPKPKPVQSPSKPKPIVLAPVHDDSIELKLLVDSAINKLREADLVRFSKHKNILVSGNGSRNTISAFVRRIYEFSPEFCDEYRFIWLINQEYKPNRIETMPTFYIPWHLMKESGWIGKNCLCLTEKEEKHVEDVDYLNWSYTNIVTAFPEIDVKFAKLLVLEMERYFEAAIDLMKPKLILIWNQFMYFSNILRGIAVQSDVQFIFIESGSFYSTFVLDSIGEMGESIPARYPGWNAWYNEPTSEELKNAETNIKYLYESGVNKKKQPRLDFSRLDFSRPTILLCGQDDIDSGIWPYTAGAAKYHSPIFSSSNSSMLYLAEIAKQNRWNIIYKPHPIMVRWNIENDDNIPDNVLYVPEGDINWLVDLADVVVTITSTSAYISLIRNKPVVMLGFIQLHDQDCTYEAFCKEDIEAAITLAIENGFTPEQRSAFIRHFAYMTKYYLFDEYRNQDVRYGQSTDKVIDFLLSAINGNSPF
jgi:hypothetical protein